MKVRRTDARAARCVHQSRPQIKSLGALRLQPRFHKPCAILYSPRDDPSRIRRSFRWGHPILHRRRKLRTCSTHLTRGASPPKLEPHAFVPFRATVPGPKIYHIDPPPRRNKLSQHPPREKTPPRSTFPSRRNSNIGRAPSALSYPKQKPNDKRPRDCVARKLRRIQPACPWRQLYHEPACAHSHLSCSIAFPTPP